jgi:hypothetical protein
VFGEEGSIKKVSLMKKLLLKMIKSLCLSLFQNKKKCVNIAGSKHYLTLKINRKTTNVLDEDIGRKLFCNGSI